MCGRFERSSSVDTIIREFRLNKTSLEMAPSYNIAPSQDILVIRIDHEGIKQLAACRWGFIPSWAKDPSVGFKTINARAETVASRPMFRSAFKIQRCLVVADGFYEWEKREKGKIPFSIHLRSGKPFGLAGLYSTWTSPDGAGICTCTIITTDANEMIGPIHDRMPVIIPKDKEDLWLDPGVQDQNLLLEMLRPYPPKEMEMYEVSPRVNSPKYNSAEAIRPLRV
jgi:putative SOS response-associated peptidase YedK